MNIDEKESENEKINIDDRFIVAYIYGGCIKQASIGMREERPEGS